MDISKKPYEISIWEDKASIHPTTNKRFFEESLIATIGSDTMDAPIRVFNPILNLNINGTSTLTFQIFSTYYDEEKDEEVENPFLKLLVNERKLKLKYDSGNRKWFDFIIKNIQEDSTTNTFSYTAYDLHIEELSKTGFNIELNPELKNNQGTVVELGERILEGSDWKVRPNVSDIIRQTIKEPLYEIILNQDITAYNMIGDESIPIISGKTIYGFYSSITEKNPYFQFLYHETDGYEVDDDRIVLNAPTGSNYYIDNVTYRDGTYSPVPSFSTSNAPPIAELYRGERLVRQQSIVYDPKIEKYVNVYKSGNTTIYGLEETEYIGATITKNFISNSEEFVTTHGWIPSTNTTITDIIYPPITPALNIQTTTFTPYLQFKFTSPTAMLMNTGIQDNRAYINNIAAGEKYVLRFKYKMGATPSTTPTGDKRLIGSVGAYTLDSNGNYQITKTYITFSPANTVVDGDTGFSYIIGTAANALSLSEMVSSRIGFFLRPGATSVNETYWLENLELFKYNTDNNGEMVVPGVPPEGIVKTIYSYYNPSSTYESLEDVQFIYRGDTPSPSYTKSYDPNFEKVRSITAAESNRYNLLQTLAETFECWVKFEIEYDEATGKMLREADGRLKKWISFHHFIGQDNQVGFHYGINVNAISRQILSDQVVTKLIVKNNANQFAEDGFCSIARAPENPSKENFLFNFKYYIQQGLLSYAEVQNDLYSNFGNWIGYIARLRTINQNRENLIKKYSLLSVEATKLESDYQTYTLVKNEANEQVLFLKAELHQYTGLSYESFLNGTEAAKLKLGDPKVKEIIKELETHSNVSKKYTPLSTIYKTNLEMVNAELKDITTQLEVDRASKDALDKEFYDKYSTFIKEGSWISEDYVDDNLYYLDAESVLYTSSSPQISYTINVLELSALEEYKAYNFNLGDKTYIEHTEFFGWVFGPNGEKTPYREEIVVSQVSYSLDDPSQNQITVQNYKNQFEELFQRITATVQAVQYQTGALARVAGIVETDGTIKTNTLQNSLAYNQFLISNAADQSVQWDQSGITITNLRKPNEVLRLVSGGILLTTDGGLSWNYGMTGAGMNADFITAGQIDASRINIVGGAFSAFRWDHTGLNAYGLTRDETGTPLWFNFNEFVRFDQFGLYGFHGEDSFVPLTEGDIWDNSGTKFALTWKGFLLRSGKKDGGYLLLDSERDFVVVDGSESEVERVRIGNLNPPRLNPRYGIQLKNSDNEVVLESSDSGSLFLRGLLSIGPNSYTPRTQLGVISTDDNDVSKIFAINNKNEEEQLAMYDDGLIVANRIEIKGNSKIGNMTIEQYEQSLEKFLVRANTEIFRVIPAQGATPEQVNPTSIDIEVDYENIGSVNDNAITWSYSTDFETWTPLGSTGKKIMLSYTDHKAKFDATGAIIIRASYNSRFSFINLSRVMDGTVGKDGIDGPPGEQGPPGKDANQYRIEANAEAIVRYKEYADTSTPASPIYATQVSPQIYEARVYKEGTISPTTDYILDFQIYTRPDESAVELAWVSIEELKNPPYSFITSNTSTNVWEFNIEGLINYDDTDASYIVKQTKNLLINGDFFRIVVKSLDEEIQTTRAVAVRNAVGDDLASFSILASKIAMAVHNTKLDFSLDGLNIYNGGLSIFRENEKVFYADEYGNLVLKGVVKAESGYFAGELRAATGRFSGTVTIEQGSITGDLGVSGLLDLGGIKLDGRNPEESGERRGIYSTNYIEGEEGFYISPDGEISVNSISLGSNASIQKYIRLGDAWFINPVAHSIFTPEERTDSLLESGDFIVVNREVSEGKTRLLSIKDSGRIELGSTNSSLTIDAATASIFSGNYVNGTGTGWSITPTEATFNNIVARGSIRASVLEYAEVQAVGGVMIVRPSSIIKSARKGEGDNNNVFVTLENRNGFRSEDYCKLQITGSGLSSNVYKILLPSGASPILDAGEGSPLGDDGVEIELQDSSEISNIATSLVGRPLINFGIEGSIGIGINSSSNSSLVAPSAVSVFQLNTGGEGISLDTKVILGEIPNHPEFGNLGGTYGLYADNVLVKGSLIAQGETYYSGISSNLLYQSDDDTDADLLQTNSSPILIWAGAEGATTENVINSLFKVYADGSFFAGKGFFKGSIITDAHITAAEIRTAVIKGWGRDPSIKDEGYPAALTIEDTDFGINFTDGDISKFKLETLLMTVNTEMKLGSGYRFDSSSPFNATRLFIYDSNTTSTVAITPSRIGFTQNRYQENITFNSFINYNEGLNLYDTSGQETLMAKFKTTATRIYNNTELTQNLVLGDQMEFKQIRNGSNEVIGYDVFVREPN